MIKKNPFRITIRFSPYYVISLQMSFIHSSLRILTFIWDTTVWGRQMLFISTKPSFVNYNWFWLVVCGENEELDVKTSSSSFPWATMTILCFLLAHSYFACVHTCTYNTNLFFFFILSVTNFGIPYTIDRGLVFTHSVIVQNFDWMLHFQQWKPRFEFCCFSPFRFFFLDIAMMGKAK